MTGPACDPDFITETDGDGRGRASGGGRSAPFLRSGRPRPDQVPGRTDRLPGVFEGRDADGFGLPEVRTRVPGTDRSRDVHPAGPGEHAVPLGRGTDGQARRRRDAGLRGRRLGHVRAEVRLRTVPGGYRAL